MLLIITNCNGMIPYSMTRRLITSAVVDAEDDGALVYVKGYEKRE